MDCEKQACIYLFDLGKKEIKPLRTENYQERDEMKGQKE